MTQPEALRLAKFIDERWILCGEDANIVSAELRRLHGVNEELVEALQLAIDSHGYLLMIDPPQDAWKAHGVESKARAALAKARGTE